MFKLDWCARFCLTVFSVFDRFVGGLNDMEGREVSRTGPDERRNRWVAGPAGAIMGVA
jgi:hypothetical protein